MPITETHPDVPRGHNAADLVAGDSRGRVHFTGSTSAELFSRELAASIEGALLHNVWPPARGEMAGFVSASAQGRVCTGQFWSRDGGTTLRELVHWGLIGHASLVAACILKLSRKNDHGFYACPMYWLPGERACGDELDGTATIVIGLCLLWARLGDRDPLKACIYRFLHDESSPLAYFHHALGGKPLIDGGGEFGGGMGISGTWCNVVQNGLCRIALLAGAQMEKDMGEQQMASAHQADADRIGTSMMQHLVATDGGWLWCIDPKTLLADRHLLDEFWNKGFAGINGALCMQSDVLGMDPTGPGWLGVECGVRTMERLLQEPSRREFWEKHGMFAQFASPPYDRLTSPSYGQGYAIQTMLLLDRMPDCQRAMDFLAVITHTPPDGYRIDRESPYWFYERILIPEFPDITSFDQGCGALNQVNVSEPMKIARLLIGVDDVRPAHTVIMPRVPPAWTGYAIECWPILTSSGLVRVDARFTRIGKHESFSLTVRDGLRIPHVTVRLGDHCGRKEWSFRDTDAFSVG